MNGAPVLDRERASERKSAKTLKMRLSELSRLDHRITVDQFGAKPERISKISISREKLFRAFFLDFSNLVVRLQTN